MKYEYIKDGIKYNIDEHDLPQKYLGATIAKGDYEYDDDGNIIGNVPLLNAIDINWNDAELPNSHKVISSTSDLLNAIDNPEVQGNANSIPVIDENEVDELPEKYISASPVSVLPDNTDDNVISTLFSAIRSLQAEVTKLRNTFKYGINSYNDNNTVMSEAIIDADDVEENEPLWTIDESELSGIDNFLDIGFNHKLTPSENVEIALNSLIIHDATFDTSTLLSNISDPKTFLYFTSSSLDFSITLESNDEENPSRIIVDFSRFGKNLSVNKFDIMFMLSQQVEVNEDFVGTNFMYTSIGEYMKGTTLYEGYIHNNNIYSTEKQLDKIYHIASIHFGEVELFKLNAYTKYQDFSKSIVPSKPSDNDLKYEVAYITIRSVESNEMLQNIKQALQENELVIEKKSKQLYIKLDGELVAIGSKINGNDDDNNNNNDNDMTPQQEEILNRLIHLGIVNNADGSIELSTIAGIDLINVETGKKYNVSIDPYGKLVSRELDIESLVENVNELGATISNIEESMPINDRGFVGTYRILKSKGTVQKLIETRSDAGLNADRIKISSIYAPLNTDDVFGCTHAFIELENLSDKDFPLDGCYLHYDRLDANDNHIVSHLALKGILKANSTFLIRGKRYAYETDINTYISVNDYDMEWYDLDGKLIDLTQIDETSLATKVHPYTFALTYTAFNVYNNTNSIDEDLTEEYQDRLRNLSYSTQLVRSSNANDKINGKAILSKSAYVYDKQFIDAVGINKSNGTWCPDTSNASFLQYHNSMYRNMFELDPAKQAYNALTTNDSSRQRWGNRNNDLNTLNLDLPKISFPHSHLTKDIKDYAPKASYQNRNVCTDKTQVDLTKPNAVSCSFGIDVFKTRCFNWVSAGKYNEYVWIYDNDDNLIGKFESYKECTQDEFNGNYAIYNASAYPRRKEYTLEINNVIYKRITKRFPASNVQYTSHKCVVEIRNSETSLTEPKTYRYVVGRQDDLNPNVPSSEYRSEDMYFTMYPSTFEPHIYQTSDQQGFHWVEYQAWTAAANMIYDKIEQDTWNHDANGNRTTAKGFIPVVLNTGDMTQNGTRVNEWLDYYNGGYKIFKEYEQNNIVGNNDLCGTNVDILGTGDDIGKSNSFYYFIFNCCDVDIDNPPIIVGHRLVNNSIVESKTVMPSFYYFDIGHKRFIMLNSEATRENCMNWYFTRYAYYAQDSTGNYVENEDNKIEYPVNVYTGFTIGSPYKYAADDPIYGFKTVYEMLYQMTSDSSKKYLMVMHEMPFTVITNASLKRTAGGTTGQDVRFRSFSDAATPALVGSHMNQIDKTDDGPGVYWFSRLLEYRKIRSVIGGHKHTYSCTYGVRENYYWVDDDGEYHWSLNEPKDMEPTLKSEWLENSYSFAKPNAYSCNRVKWIVDLEKMVELNEWNEDPLHYTPDPNDDLNGKKYANGHNLSKFPFCEGKGFFEDYSVETNTETNTKTLRLQNTANILLKADGANAQTYLKIFYPVHYVDSIESPVRYFMMQATGYKLKSNKELPSNAQRFSCIIPSTTHNNGSDKPDGNQQRPMFGDILWTTSVVDGQNVDTLTFKVIRVENILFTKGNPGVNFTGGNFTFTQMDYSTGDMKFMSLSEADKNDTNWDSENSLWKANSKTGKWSNGTNGVIFVDQI